MAIEAKRGCGYRKVGGFYMVSGKLGMPCCNLPILLRVCPCCNQGIKQSRGWTWIDPKPFLKPCTDPMGKFTCAAAGNFPERVGLIWIGTQFYPTPEAFSLEANSMGVSRRIHAIPRGFELDRDWVFLAHPKVKQEMNPDTGELEWVGGIFRIFKPERIEKIVTETMAKDEEAMAELAKRNITPFIVPDNDPDHQGTVYDKEENEPELKINYDCDPIADQRTDASDFGH